MLQTLKPVLHVKVNGLSTAFTLQTLSWVFNSSKITLEQYDSYVLDVFGGSGALSLESISRGASEAYIIDNKGKELSDALDSNVKIKSYNNTRRN